MQQASKTNTKAALIRAAERLFAEKGLGTVSVKDITIAAGARNPSAVHYHFGNIEVLIREVFANRYEAIEQARLKRLAEIEKSAKPWSLETYLEAAIGPLFEGCLDEDGRLYARFCIQLATDPRFDLLELVQDIGMESAGKMRAGLIQSLGDLAEAKAQNRFRLAFTLSLILTADFARQVEAGTAPPVHEAVCEAAMGLAGFLRA